ncbi:tRNA (guanosine(46)-N7)-methyltransferase TrmB [Canibacter zhuwentaonis]|uniref:tRNA (guanosine(46)-N7)-methyltransferase TrmB n=1 Tax=Canibacter zhuwentaonis TaxID=2837491 RepID=UPI0035100DD7
MADLTPHRMLSFVRRGGRMSQAKQRALTELAPKYLIDCPRAEGATSVAPGLQTPPAEWFGRVAPVVVEIGSGQGQQLVYAAERNPGSDFVGVEVYTAGIARTMLMADAQRVDNLRLVEANAPEVLTNLLPQGAVSEVWIFFPDPWHKARHNKRRLVDEGFVPVLQGALKPGGVVRLATDWQEYAEQMREVLDGADAFARDFEGEWAPRFEGRTLTAFERKGIAKGRSIYDLCYILRD